MRKIVYIICVLLLISIVGCTEQKVGADKDIHGCIGSAGYTWCDSKQKCLRSWEEVCPAAEQVCLADSDCLPKPECHPMECINKNSESKYVKPQMCTMEYRWNAAYNPEDCACVNGVCINKNINRTGEQNLVGADKDAHGCIGSAGYSWCEEKQKCIRIWEENCSAVQNAVD
jgi:hypothetical protein